MLNAEGIKGGFLEYKGRPLVRQDKDIYYGDLSENYHIHMTIMTERDLGNGEEIPDKIVVQLLRRDGVMTEFTWKNIDGKMVFTDTDGNRLKVNRGNSYFSFFKSSMKKSVTIQ